MLSTIDEKCKISISIVATRWVLDHDYVGCVIIGGCMKISEHVDENVEVFSFKLDKSDPALISSELAHNKFNDVFVAMGDCRAKYRS